MRQVSAALTVLRRALATWWFAWATFLAVNLLWIIGMATFVLAPPALFGLFYAANEAAHQRGAGVSDFIQGARTYFVVSWRWGALNLLVVLLCWTNFNFYPQFAGALAAPLLLITLLLLIGWLVVQFYALPYLIEQDNKSVIVALRNGLFTAAASPLFTVCLVMIVGAAIYLCAWQPVLVTIGAGSLIALLANYAVLERLDTFGARVHSPDDSAQTTDQP